MPFVLADTTGNTGTIQTIGAPEVVTRHLDVPLVTGSEGLPGSDLSDGRLAGYARTTWSVGLAPATLPHFLLDDDPSEVTRVESQTEAMAGTDLTADVDLSAPPARTDLHDPRKRHEVESAVCAVPGVLGARLVPGFERDVDELHVLTTLDKAPKQAVRDVQTVLMARFGVPTDHRVISVVQLDEDAGFASTARAGITEVGVTQAGLNVTARVSLRDGDDVHSGTAQGSSSASGRNRAVAQATVAAVQPLVGESNLVDLEGVDVVNVLGRQLAVSLLRVQTARTDVSLAGSALVRDAVPDAIARSVLDAMNRTIAEADR